MNYYEVERLERQRNDKNFARGQVTYAIKKGTLVRLPCEVCGEAEKTQAHHEDYKKPLEVIWLCKKHHTQFDKERAPKDYVFHRFLVTD